MEDSRPSQSNQSTISLRLNLWWLVGLLVIIIFAMLLIWKPWEGPSSVKRTVSTSGMTTVKAVPDEFTFSPSWEFKGNDKAAALKEAAEKSAAVVTELKKLGITDENIKTNANGWEGYYFYNQESRQHIYSLNITATVRSKDLAQKIQDYLVTTEPTGQVTPQTTFSKQLQKKLEQQGRSEATKDARAKADEMAKNLGFRVGKIVSIKDNGSGGGGYPVPMYATEEVKRSASGLAVQPGQDEMTYTVEVVYAIR